MNLLPVCAAAVFCVSFAGAAPDSYVGIWKNEPLAKSGLAKFKMQKTAAGFSGSMYFDGAIIGAPNPDPIHFDGLFDSEGIAVFETPGTDFGDLSGQMKKYGTVGFKFSNVNQGPVTEFGGLAKFNFPEKTLNGIYYVSKGDKVNSDGQFAAHVKMAPSISVLTRPEVNGKTGNVNVRVVTNATSATLKASADRGAKVKVTGSNPFTVTVSPLKTGETHVTVTGKTSDGLKKSMSLTFTKPKSSASPLEFLLGTE